MTSSRRSFYGATAGRDRWWLLHFVRSQWFRRGHGPSLNAAWRSANATLTSTPFGIPTLCQFELGRGGKHSRASQYLTRPCESGRSN